MLKNNKEFDLHEEELRELLFNVLSAPLNEQFKTLNDKIKNDLRPLIILNEEVKSIKKMQNQMNENMEELRTESPDIINSLILKIEKHEKDRSEDQREIKLSLESIKKNHEKNSKRATVIIIFLVCILLVFFYQMKQMH